MLGQNFGFDFQILRGEGRRLQLYPRALHLFAARVLTQTLLMLHHEAFGAHSSNQVIQRGVRDRIWRSKRKILHRCVEPTTIQMLGHIQTLLCDKEIISALFDDIQTWRSPWNGT